LDNLAPEKRSYCMSRIRAKDTSPELLVRRLVHRLGYRFRLHRKDLPGCPDLLLPRHRKAILVHGCFWHSHRCPRGRVVPKTDREYWHSKRQETARRDKLNIRKLQEQGWKVLVVWECWTKDIPTLSRRIESFLARS
jgi:DNA mismatch endonuclease (patch repair protein)